MAWAVGQTCNGGHFGVIRFLPQQNKFKKTGTVAVKKVSFKSKFLLQA